MNKHYEKLIELFANNDFSTVEIPNQEKIIEKRGRPFNLIEAFNTLKSETSDFTVETPQLLEAADMLVRLIDTIQNPPAAEPVLEQEDKPEEVEAIQPTVTVEVPEKLPEFPEPTPQVNEERIKLIEKIGGLKKTLAAFEGEELQELQDYIESLELLLQGEEYAEMKKGGVITADDYQNSDEFKYGKPLTKEQIKDLRSIQHIIFRYYRSAEKGGWGISGSLITGYEEGKDNFVDTNWIKPVEVGTRFYMMEKGKHASDVENVFFSETEFDWMQQQKAPLTTIFGLLKEGDKIQLHYLIANDNDNLRNAKLHQDTLMLNIYRDGKIKYQFNVTDTIYPENRARSIRYFESEYEMRNQGVDPSDTFAKGGRIRISESDIHVGNRFGLPNGAIFEIKNKYISQKYTGDDRVVVFTRSDDKQYEEHESTVHSLVLFFNNWKAQLINKHTEEVLGEKYWAVQAAGGGIENNDKVIKEMIEYYSQYYSPERAKKYKLKVSQRVSTPKGLGTIVGIWHPDKYVIAMDGVDYTKPKYDEKHSFGTADIWNKVAVKPIMDTGGAVGGDKPHYINEYFSMSEGERKDMLSYAKFKERVRLDVENYMRYKDDVKLFFDNDKMLLDLGILDETETKIPEEKKERLRKEWIEKYPQFIKGIAKHSDGGLVVFEKEMEKVAEFTNYDYYMGVDKNNKTYYNIVPHGEPAPSGGYFDKNYILKIKSLPDLFKDKESVVGDFYNDTRKGKAFQVVSVDGDKIGIQYYDDNKKPFGDIETINANEFKYYTQQGAWRKWRQSYFAAGGGVEVKWNSVTKETWWKFEDYLTGKGIVFTTDKAQELFNRFLKETGHIPCIKNEAIEFGEGGGVAKFPKTIGDFRIVENITGGDGAFKNKEQGGLPFYVEVKRNGAIVYKAESFQDAVDWIDQRHGINKYSAGGEIKKDEIYHIDTEFEKERLVDDVKIIEAPKPTDKKVFVYSPKLMANIRVNKSELKILFAGGAVNNITVNNSDYPSLDESDIQMWLEFAEKIYKEKGFFTLRQTLLETAFADEKTGTQMGKDYAKLKRDIAKKYLDNQPKMIAAGGAVGNIEHYRYLDIQQIKGGLKISINDEGREEVKELKEKGQWDGYIWKELFEDVEGNSEYMFHLDIGEAGFGLTSAEGITDGYYYGDKGELTDDGHYDSEVYWYPDYQVKSSLDEMLNDGSVIFSGSDLKAHGGNIRSVEAYNKLVDQKTKLVEKLSPKEIADMWNKEAGAVVGGISKPMTEEEAKVDNARIYLRGLLVEKELTDAEYKKYFIKGGEVGRYTNSEQPAFTGNVWTLMNGEPKEYKIVDHVASSVFGEENKYRHDYFLVPADSKNLSGTIRVGRNWLASTKEELLEMVNNPEWAKEFEAGGKVTMDKIKSLISEINEQGGGEFSLGGAYGYQELWAKTYKDGKETGSSRVEAGSKKDIYEALIKNRYNKNYQPKYADEKHAAGGAVESLVQQIKNAFPLMTDKDFDHHESDLYVRYSPEVDEWLKNNYEFYKNITKFNSNIGDGKWIEIPFAAWEMKYRAAGGAVKKAKPISFEEDEKQKGLYHVKFSDNEIVLVDFTLPDFKDQRSEKYIFAQAAHNYEDKFAAGGEVNEYKNKTVQEVSEIVKKQAADYKKQGINWQQGNPEFNVGEIVNVDLNYLYDAYQRPLPRKISNEGVIMYCIGSKSNVIIDGMVFGDFKNEFIKHKSFAAGGAVVSNWEKQLEWEGNPELGYDSYKKVFINPFNGRKVSVFVFGKKDLHKQPHEISDWHFMVSAGANSEYSHSGGFPDNVKNSSVEEAMKYVDELYGKDRLIYEAGGAVKDVITFSNSSHTSTPASNREAYEQLRQILYNDKKNPIYNELQREDILLDSTDGGGYIALVYSSMQYPRYLSETKIKKFLDYLKTFVSMDSHVYIGDYNYRFNNYLKATPKKEIYEDEYDFAAGGKIEIPQLNIGDLKYVCSMYYDSDAPFKLFQKVLTDKYSITRKEAFTLGRFIESLQAFSAKMREKQNYGMYQNLILALENIKSELLMDDKFSDGGSVAVKSDWVVILKNDKGKEMKIPVEASDEHEAEQLARRLSGLNEGWSFVEAKQFAKGGEIDYKISAKYNIVRYGNKGMEVQSNSGRQLQVFNSKPTDVENWNEAVEWAERNTKAIQLAMGGQLTLGEYMDSEFVNDEPQTQSVYAAGGSIAKKCKLGMKLQTLLFDKKYFTEKQAKAWAHKHGFKYGDVDGENNFWRLRQINPEEFLKKPYGTNIWTKGIKAVFACPKKPVTKGEGGSLITDNRSPITDIQAAGGKVGKVEWQGKKIGDFFHVWEHEGKDVHWYIDAYENEFTHKINLNVYEKYGNSQQPIFYGRRTDGGQMIGYDNPYTLPRYVKDKVLEIYLANSDEVFADGGVVESNDPVELMIKDAIADLKEKSIHGSNVGEAWSSDSMILLEYNKEYNWIRITKYFPQNKNARDYSYSYSIRDIDKYDEKTIIKKVKEAISAINKYKKENGALAHGMNYKIFSAGGEISQGEILINPHHSSREEYAELIDYLDDNSWKYKKQDAPHAELDYVVVSTVNVSREEVVELKQYLENNSWDWKEGTTTNNKQQTTNFKANGGKIGFDALARKVAKTYKGKKVAPEYQSEYGKRYDAEEAKEVGRKIAAKVYRQQQAAKKEEGGSTTNDKQQTTNINAAGGKVRAKKGTHQFPDTKQGKYAKFMAQKIMKSGDGIETRKMVDMVNKRFPETKNNNSEMRIVQFGYKLLEAKGFTREHGKWIFI